MSLFDHFEPAPKKRCPKCFASLNDWQGSDGPSGLFHWRQHQATPKDQKASPDVKISEGKREQLSLPEKFTFHTACDVCAEDITAEGLCIDGIWRHTFIRDPEVPYPSGEEHPLFRVNILLEELAQRLGKASEIDVYEEDGLGTYRALWLKLDFGASAVLKQSDHLTNVAMYGERAHQGPVVYIDAYEATTLGYRKFYWSVLHALNISEANIDGQYVDAEQWLEDARELLQPI